MKGERKKMIAFAMIITFFTSVYTAFLNTVMKQGFSGDYFFINWINKVPKTYLLLLPFVLVAGRVTSALVAKIFSNEKEAN